MPSEVCYQLIDFGNGRKLESIGDHTIIRPSPAANGVRPHDPTLWHRVDAIYDVECRSWIHHHEWPDGRFVDCGKFRMPVRPTPFGHIGLFPEQADNWNWLSSASSRETINPDDESTLALNLFGYTGASTIALAMSGFSVVHVDASKPSVSAARDAASLNGLGEAPVRYLVDDAAKFVRRENRRGRTYHTILLDPPSYGHSPKGRAWRLERDLWPLIDDCLALLQNDQFRLLITGHSAQVSEADIVRHLWKQDRLILAGRQDKLKLQSGRSGLRDQSGRKLDTGFFVRVESV